MREPLKLSESEIIAAVETHYGISTAAFSFLPLGNDSATAVYRLDGSNGRLYFVKLRTSSRFSVPSLAVPQFLHAQGVPHLLAPLTAINDDSWVPVNDFALILYPFIDKSRTAARGGLTDSQWQEFGSVVRRFHDAPLSPELLSLLPREQFVPKQSEQIKLLQAAVARAAFENDAEREMAELWRSHQSKIDHLTNRAQALGSQLQRASARFVLCHADIHTFNVLMDQANEFWLVDWDEVILALPERDLMFVVGGISTALVSSEQTTHFLRGYGGPPPDAAALTYYRFAWAVQDMAAYGESVFMLRDVSDASRGEAVQGFKHLFAPGEIVEIAMASEP